MCWKSLAYKYSLPVELTQKQYNVNRLSFDSFLLVETLLIGIS